MKKGNSSSFTTTMIRTKDGTPGGPQRVEWACHWHNFRPPMILLSRFRRAASRLVQMGGKNWGQQ